MNPITTRSSPISSRSPLRAIPARWDWYELDRAVGIELGIGQVPGAVLAPHGRFFNVHRTHLPLLGDLGHQMLASTSSPVWSHAEREARAAARNITLRGTQQTGLDFIEPRRGVLLADDMRLGKTLTSLLAHDPARGPLLVIAPLSVRSVWLQWMKTLWPDVEPFVILGQDVDLDKLRTAQIIFGHYDVLTHHRITSLRPGTFIVDEAHLLSNAKSKRTDAVLFYATAAQRTILLTGTPLWNTSKGLWALLAACNPGAWDRLFGFAQRYCNPIMGEYGWTYEGVSATDEWGLRRDEMLIARRWEDIQLDLPPIQYSTEMIDLDTKDLLELDRLAYELRRNDKSQRVEDMNYYRQATGMFKVPLAVESAIRVMQTGRHVVVWTWHDKVAKAIASKLKAKKYDAFVATGNASLAQREEQMDAWRASDCGALVISIVVGQVGIDLSRAHYAIFAEIDWTPAVVAQAVMRTFSALRAMSITWLLVNHEIELALHAAMHGKITTGLSIGASAAGSMFQIPQLAFDARDQEALLGAFEAAVLSGAGGSV